MATGTASACFSPLTVAASPRGSGIPQTSFIAGLRLPGRFDPVNARLAWHGKTAAARRNLGRIRCDAPSTQLVVTLSTSALLFLGRFVFLPFQREQVARAGLPKQNGVTHLEAGDTRAAEVSSFLKTNDPAGFTIVDVLAWGALGHAIAFFILATASNGYDPQF